MDEGGCGTFYAITIASSSFSGLPIVKQHRLVNDTLKEEISGIHGLQVRLTFILAFTLSPVIEMRLKFFCACLYDRESCSDLLVLHPQLKTIPESK